MGLRRPALPHGCDAEVRCCPLQDRVFPPLTPQAPHHPQADQDLGAPGPDRQPQAVLNRIPLSPEISAVRFGFEAPVRRDELAYSG